jgi:hypothetical protein
MYVSAPMTSVAAPAPDNPPGPASERVHATPRASRRRSNYSLAVGTIAVVVVYGAIRLGVHLRGQLTPLGDVALIELGVRQAVFHANALGVYSRFGWHHPGPALFYALAPWYWLSGESSRSLFLGAWLINGVSALGAVWIVRARAGEYAARVMAIAVLAHLLIVHVIHVIDPWNPKVLAFPLLLLMVSAASAYSGSVWSFVIAAVTATYLVQTHLGTFPISMALLALAAIGFPRGRSRASWASARTPLIVGAGLLSLMWIGPFVQEITHSNGNLTQIASFYLHPAHRFGPHTHSLRSSVIAVTNRSTVFPLGNPKDALGHRGRLLTAVGFGTLGFVVALVARRRSRFIAALGLTTTIGLVVAVLAASRIVGSQDGYLFYWTETLPLPAAMAGAWILADRARRVRGPAEPRASTRRSRVESVLPALIAGAVVVLGVVSLHAVAQAKTVSTGDARAEREIAGRIEREVGSKDEHFTIHVDTSTLQEDAVALQLDKDGYHFYAEPTLNLYHGNIAKPGAGPVFELRYAQAHDIPSLGEQPLVTVGGLELSRRA